MPTAGIYKTKTAAKKAAKELTGKWPHYKYKVLTRYVLWKTKK